MFNIGKGKKQRYATIEKVVGETPLMALERLRTALHIPKTTPLAYAGRLDPMAEGKLLILIGDECKVQEKYHAFDKEYRVEVLLGASSDTGDVLGLLSLCDASKVSESVLQGVLKSLIGSITLPYPHFSSRTVGGKPLHVWALEKRLHEISIPEKKSHILKISRWSLRTVSKGDILKEVRQKIETIPTVTDASKVLGADFRRDDVRKSWDMFEQDGTETYTILSYTCIASSGTYMRSLSERIAKQLGTCGLAYSIHRTKIGKYRKIGHIGGFWSRSF